ncbi:MAG: NADH-quinone oxidoreductase subunit L [Phycisphaerales bacterium]|nr:NADH-quinone oxidoreductase subunit L [Phycisphaerales bacterium]
MIGVAPALNGVIGALAQEGPAHAATAAGPAWAALIPALPLLGVVLCTLCAVFRVKNRLPAVLTVACLAGAFGLTVWMFLTTGHGTAVTTSLDWIRFHAAPGHEFVSSWGFFIDPLTCLWMLFVTGLATLIAIYAGEYMAGDAGAGYSRFFAAFNLFVFSMACLVMADSLVLLFLGWEGVGLCSYLLIGYFYKRPAAVAAAKKAFIMNRIGDVGLMMGITSTWVVFGTVEYAPIFDMISRGVDGAGNALPEWAGWVIPSLFTIGAFGKSAQLFLYVWLPDAMEGPTPVSALIHAATMVTAGVYLIARMYPMYVLDGTHWVLTLIAWSGAITALWSATIGMAQFDIKRIMAYSTVSQLGYMFAGLGVLTTTGAAFHVFTHAFFKATLFLCCGAVMHGFAGQLDLRRVSGLWSMRGWAVVTIAMLVGCLNLAGFPFTAGFFSKDMIIAECYVTPGMAPVGWVLLLTAGLTAYYTFRVFFRVFVGPAEFEPGDEAHAHGPAGDDHGHAAGAGTPSSVDSTDHSHGFHPHAPGLAINFVLGLLAVLSLAAAATYFVGGEHGWVGEMVHHSTAGVSGAALPGGGAVHADLETGAPGFLGYNPHAVMYYVSAAVGLIGILIAAFLHGPRGVGGLLIGSRRHAATSRADALLPVLGPVARGAQHKWYVDEVYDFLIIRPIWVIAHLFHLFDKLIVDGLVGLAGWLPRGMGGAIRPTQSGHLHGYAVGMAGGVAVLLLVVLLVAW